MRRREGGWVCLKVGNFETISSRNSKIYSRKEVNTEMGADFFSHHRLVFEASM